MRTDTAVVDSQRVNRINPRTTSITSRRLASAVLAIVLCLALTGGDVSAQATPFTGDIPEPGSFGLVSWAGGSLDQLEGDSSAAGCQARAVWATSEGRFIPYLFSAPTFVNRPFLDRYPQALPPGALLLACEPDTASAPGSTTARFETLGVGAALPSGAACASRVRPAPEIRPANATYNNTRGTSPHDLMPRVDGDFTGTTDELIQWAACKWGIDEDVARAQVTIESWWRQITGGDLSHDPNICHPDVRTASGPCPESIGLMQVRFQYHGEAFEDANAIRSAAYNLDYAFAKWRECYEGDLDWLNTVERGHDYVAGDMWGCTGVWFSGRWYTAPAVQYIGRVQQHLEDRTWETAGFAD